MVALNLILINYICDAALMQNLFGNSLQEIHGRELLEKTLCAY